MKMNKRVSKSDEFLVKELGRNFVIVSFWYFDIWGLWRILMEDNFIKEIYFLVLIVL